LGGLVAEQLAHRGVRLRGDLGRVVFEDLALALIASARAEYDVFP
jgi:hypothetical protein